MKTTKLEYKKRARYLHVGALVHLTERRYLARGTSETLSFQVSLHPQASFYGHTCPHSRASSLDRRSKKLVRY